MTPDDARARLRAAINEAGNSREFARAIGVSEALVSQMLTGVKEPGGRILRAIGLRRRVIYEPIGEAAE